MGCNTSSFVEEEAFLRERNVAVVEYHPPKRWTPEQRTRLYRVMHGDGIIVSQKLNTDLFDKEFARFLEQRQRSIEEYHFFWDSVGFRDNLKVLRRQQSGLCYMHAPVVLQHYLVAMQHPTSVTGMIDVANYINQCWTGEQLQNFLLHNSGGDSRQFLREITQQPSLELDMIMLRSIPQDCWHIVQQLNHMPALVSAFVVEERFLKSREVYFEGSLEKTRVGQHAMVLIGWRFDVQLQEHCFVLQNWWDHRYFIEVTASYLKQTGAIVSFVKDPLTSIPDSFPITTQRYVETTMDRCEGLAEWMT